MIGMQKRNNWDTILCGCFNLEKVNILRDMLLLMFKSGNRSGAKERNGVGIFERNEVKRYIEE